jgi:CDP-glycerol glycerophosphotransferase (TagB/SpsB family)
MRQIYINEYIKAGERDGFVMDRAELEKKFLGLGSPKFDRVARVRREDIDVPEEWLSIIQKPDGSRKKVIFYNTSVNALLHAQDKMIKKIRRVFETFRENREEVALLWRPHPLMQDTIKAMLPELWEEYQAIVREYREAGWGIYDDTPDLDRAIALSDAYYGDGSSVVQLCQKAGLPVMIQNVDVE